MVDYGELLAYAILLVIGVSIYLKKSNQTLPELMRRIIDFFRDLDEIE